MSAGTSRPFGHAGMVSDTAPRRKDPSGGRGDVGGSGLQYVGQRGPSRQVIELPTMVQGSASWWPSTRNDVVSADAQPARRLGEKKNLGASNCWLAAPTDPSCPNVWLAEIGGREVRQMAFEKAVGLNRGDRA